MQNSNSKATPTTPEILSNYELFHATIMHGSGFEDGKFRIAAYAENKPKLADLATFLKNEYGTSGRTGENFHSGGIVSHESHDCKGIKLELTDGRTLSMKWYGVAKIIAELVKNGDYITTNDVDERTQTARNILENKDGIFGENRIGWAKKVFAEYELNLPNSEPPQELEPKYAVGDTVYLEDGKAFKINRISEYSGEVQLIDESLMYPILRAESKEQFEWMLQVYDGNEHLFVPVVATNEVAETTENIGISEKLRARSNNIEVATSRERGKLPIATLTSGITEPFSCLTARYLTASNPITE
jgi:hypothetical protein